jgi:hypothetical protein
MAAGPAPSQLCPPFVARLRTTGDPAISEPLRPTGGLIIKCRLTILVRTGEIAASVLIIFRVESETPGAMPARGSMLAVRAEKVSPALQIRRRRSSPGRANTRTWRTYWRDPPRAPLWLEVTVDGGPPIHGSGDAYCFESAEHTGSAASARRHLLAHQSRDESALLWQPCRQWWQVPACIRPSLTSRVLRNGAAG